MGPVDAADGGIHLLALERWDVDVSVYWND